MVGPNVLEACEDLLEVPVSGGDVEALIAPKQLGQRLLVKADLSEDEEAHHHPWILSLTAAR